MKPRPRARHFIAILIFLAVAGSYGVMAFHETRLTDRQVLVATSALKDHDPSLFAYDNTFGPGGKWRLDSPMLLGLMKLALVPSGYADPALPFRMMTGVVALIYMLGMYWLLWEQTRSWSVAAYMAVVSTATVDLISRLPWGFGALEATEPGMMCLALLPLVMLAYLRYERRWQIVLVFGSIGLMANIDLSTALNILAVLWPVYLLRGRCHWRVLVLGGAGLLLAATMAAPYVAYLLALRVSMGLPEAGSSYEAALEALAISGDKVFYPALLGRLVNVGLMAGIVAFGIPGVLVLTGLERYRLRNRSLWGWMLLMSLVAAFGLTGVSQLIGKTGSDAPPLTCFFDAMRLLVLPLVVLLAQGLTNLFRLRRYRQALRWICLAVFIVWVVPSPNLRPARHALLSAAAQFTTVEERPASVLRHRREAQQHAELARLAAWLNANASLNAVVLADDIDFRLLSRRSTYVCHGDVRYEYVLMPQGLPDWLNSLSLQASALSPAGLGDPHAIESLVASLAQQERFAGVEEWYVLLGGRATFDVPCALVKIRPDMRWQWHQLYRVDLTPVTDSDEGNRE